MTTPYAMTNVNDERIGNYLDGLDTAADWTPVPPGDVDRAWSMAAHLTKLHRYHLAAYLGWSTAYGRGLCTEAELRDYLDCYELADALGISWRGWL